MKILVCDKLNTRVIEDLSKIGEVIDISGNEKRGMIKDEIEDTSIVVVRSSTKISKDLIESSKELKIIARAGAGVDNIDVNAATNNNIHVVNAPLSNVLSVAELTVGLILSVARNIVPANISMKKAEWSRSEFVGIELFEKKLGLVGFGRIGKLVAERMLTFGVNIGIYDPYISSVEEPFIKFESLDDLLVSSDIVSLHLPKTPETTNLISKEKLDLLKKDAIFINTSRGGMVDEEALFKKKEKKEIYGFGLDVYSKEPPEYTDDLLDTTGTTLPHLGASTVEAQLRAGQEVVENIKRILNGDEEIALNTLDIK
ncbi:MAG: hydroxyacid dehydrogenase [Candidatus Actinomarinales bacterium]|nr:MAG: hydroxyacid dehydrogenase [Candidatus Actinomarinales bacterium]